MEKNLLYNIAKMCEWRKTVNDKFIGVCDKKIEKLQNLLPSGSGIDYGCKIDVKNSGKNKVVILFDFHFLNDSGYYDGCENYRIIIKPELTGFDMRIIGKNREQIKDYFYDLFNSYLNETIEI